jgi:HEAT repeat protein
VGVAHRRELLPGRPTSYWRGQIIRAEELRQAQSSPPPKPTLPNLFPKQETSVRLDFLEDPEAVPVLTDMLRDRIDHVRWKAAFALVKQLKAELPDPVPVWGRSRPAPWLADKLGPRTPLVVQAMSEALIRPVDCDERAGAAVILFELGQDAGPAIPALVEALKEKRCDGKGIEVGGLRVVGVGEVATVILARLGPSGIKTLLTTLKAGDVVSRTYAIRAVGKIEPRLPEAIPILREALQDEAVSNEAALALWRLDPNNEVAIPALVRGLRSAQTGRRYGAASSLRQIGPPAKEAVPTLLSMLSDPDEMVRQMTGLALKSIDPGAAARAGVP